MKNTKKLIPALGMLLLSACMLVTSTFAWFSMNTEVSATNMQVTAKGDQVYLQIVKSNAGFQDGQPQTTVAAAANSKQYIPTNAYKTFNETTPTAYDGTTVEWVTATSNDPTVSTKYGKYKNVTSSIDSYAYITSYDLRLDPKAGAVDGGKLKISSVTMTTDDTTDFNKCVSVLVTCTYNETTLSAIYSNGTKHATENYYELAKQTGSKDSLTSVAFPSSTVGNVKIVTVSVYVFFNGDSDYCKTAAVTDKVYSISVSFNVDADA